MERLLMLLFLLSSITNIVYAKDVSAHGKRLQERVDMAPNADAKMVVVEEIRIEANLSQDKDTFHWLCRNYEKDCDKR